MKISVIGLGKLGLPMAAFYASKGHKVTGLDVNTEAIKQLQAGECTIDETDLEPLLSQQDIKFTTDFADVLDSKIVFVIVPTPSRPNGQFSNEYVLSALEHLRDYAGLVAITSTVMPGSCEEVFKPMLPNASVCYSPEFIALGSVLHNMERPDAILIGEDTKDSGNLLEAFHRTLCDTPICRMSLWNAELVKIFLNVFITTKISLANTIAEACERIPDGNVEDAVHFLGLDGRIGSKYLTSGPGFGGPCFPRDNKAFISFAKKLHINYQLQSATDEFNEAHCRAIALRIITLCEGDTVSILGLTYKTDTSVVEESRAIKIAKALNKTYKIKVYDPMGMHNALKELGGVKYCSDATECLSESDLCVITTPWPEFAKLDFSCMRREVVLDCWRILKNVEGIEYHAVGVNDAGSR